MEKDIGYKLIKSINLCFIYIQFFRVVGIFWCSSNLTIIGV